MRDIDKVLYIAGKYKRVYLGIGTTLIGLFAILQLYGLQINDLSGDIVCAGTPDDPCISYFDVVNPTAKSIYIYNYNEVQLDFSPDIDYYELYVKYYGKWHYTNFTKETRLGNIPKDRKYSFVFPRYSTKHFKLVGYKHNPTDSIKWGVGTSGAYLDPLWEGVEAKDQQINTGIKTTATDSWFTTITSDTELFYDIETIEYDGTDFKIILKVNDTLIKEKEAEIKENEKEPKEPKEGDPKVYTSTDDIKEEMYVLAKDYYRGIYLTTKDLYTDYNKSTGKKNYTVSMPAKYSILLPDGNITEITRKEVTLKLGENSIYITATLGTDLTIQVTTPTAYNATIDVSEGALIINSSAEDKYVVLSSSAITYNVVKNNNMSMMIEVPETNHNFTFNPTNIIENQSSVTFNTTNSDYFGNEVVTITSEYSGEQNLTRVRITNPYPMNQYDVLDFNLTEYLGWNPDDIQNVWYDSYTGNTDNSTLKDTSDYNVWVDTTPENKTGLVLDIRFEELSGTQANDHSTYNNHGTLTNMNTGYNNDSSGWTTEGKYGYAADFDGVDDYVEISDSQQWDDIDTEGTISLWFNTNNIPSIFNYETLISRRDGSTNIWAIYLQGDFSGKLYFIESGGDTVLGGNVPIIGQWQHVVVTWKPDNAILYQDTVITATDTSTNGIGTGAIGLAIGNRIGGGRELNGTIDEVKIWNRALTPSEISNSYNRKKDYYNSMPRQESGITAGSDWDVFVQNGTVSSIATNRIVMKPAISTTTPTMWAIDFAFDSSGMSAYDTSCGTFEALNTTTVSTHRNGTYCISYPMENSVYGSQEKQNIGLWQFPQRYEEDTYRTFFTIQENLTADVVIELPVNITEILDRTELTANVNDTTYKIYRINENGWVYNDTGICYEQPVEVGE